MKHCQNKSNISIVQDYLDGVRPVVVTGYREKKYKKRKIGDVWTDAKGISWEQKSSGPVRINRVAEIIRAALNDKCKCGQVIKWGSKRDQQFFRRTGLCENCLIDYETKLRVLGIYDSYEKYKILSNQVGVLNDAKNEITDVIKFFSSNNGDVEMVCNSEGFIERWRNANPEGILESANKDLQFVETKLVEIQKERDDAKAIYVTEVAKYNMESYV